MRMSVINDPPKVLLRMSQQHVANLGVLKNGYVRAGCDRLGVFCHAASGDKYSFIQTMMMKRTYKFQHFASRNSLAISFNL